VSQGKPRVLVVDDEELNREIIAEYLSGGQYELDMAEDGSIAWSKLEADPDAYDVVLLDRMMPNLNGMEVLARMKGHPDLRSVPVILQTARASKEDMLEGIRAGAYYYLIKPFEEEMLFSVVETAARDSANYRHSREALRQTAQTVGLLKEGLFQFRTLSEARNLATLVAQTCPRPEAALLGLTELLVNAVEHGNLGITYAEKTQLHAESRWEEEVERRLNDPEYGGRVAELQVSVGEDKETTLVVRDQGSGFDWRQYMEFSPERATHTHGRGITMANKLSFDSLEYQGSGNTVVATALPPRD
jgi:CheY-like chemotaxis protein